MHPRRAGMVRAAAPVSGGSPTTGGDADERRLARFYAHHGKHHLLPNVPRMVSDARAEGGLEMMFDALCRLHGPEPPPPLPHELLLPPPPRLAHPEEREAYARRLAALYERHRPARLCDVDTLLDAYAGREDDLIRALVAKYGPEPEPPQRRSSRGGAGGRGRSASMSSGSSSESLPAEDVSFLSSHASVRQQQQQRQQGGGGRGRAGPGGPGVDGSFAEDPVQALLVENRVLLRKRQFAVLRHVREAAAERLLRRLYYRLLERVWRKRCRTTVEDAAAAGQREIERELATNCELHGQIEDLKRRLCSTDGDGGGDGPSAAVAAGEEPPEIPAAQQQPRNADAAAVPPAVTPVLPPPAVAAVPSPSPSPSQGDAWQRRQQQQLVQRLLVENNLLRELGLSQRASRRRRRRRRRRRSESRSRSRRRGDDDGDGVSDRAPLAIAAPAGAVRPAGGALRRDPASQNPAAGERGMHGLRALQQQRHPPQAHGQAPRSKTRVGSTREERELQHLLRFLGEAEDPRAPPAPAPVHVTVRPTLSPPRSRRAPGAAAPPAAAPFFGDHRRPLREAALAASPAAAAGAASGGGGGFHRRSLPSPLQAPSAEFVDGRSIGPFVSPPQPQPQQRAESLGAAGGGGGGGGGGAPAALPRTPGISSAAAMVPALASPRIRRQTVSIDFPGGGQQRREVVVGTFPPGQQQQQQQPLSEVAASSTQLPSGDLSAVTSLGGFFDGDASGDAASAGQQQQRPHPAATAAVPGGLFLSEYEKNVARHNKPGPRAWGVASSVTPQPVDPAAAARDAFALHKATQGLGTDGAAVFAVVERVRSQGEWDEVQRQFGYAFPSTHGGSLVGVLADALNKAGWRRCEELLARRRIVLEAPTRAPPAVHHAAVLHGALAGLGTDGAAVVAVVERVRSQEEWDEVKGQFRRAYPQHCGGDLLEALAEDLNKRELQRCREVLGGKRVAL